MTVTLTASCSAANDTETQDVSKTLAFVLQCVYFVYKHENTKCLTTWLAEPDSKFNVPHGKNALVKVIRQAT